MIKFGFRRFFSSIPDATKIINETKQFIFDVNTYQDWTEKVMSCKVPVVLHCFAQWSGKWVDLDKILMERAIDALGAWSLGRLDVDEIPELASSLQVIKVPSLFLINHGNAIHSIHGNPSNDELELLLSDLKLLSGLASDVDIIKGMLKACQEFLANKEYANAIFGWQDALRQPGSHHGECHVGIAQAYHAQGDMENALKSAKIVQDKHTDRLSDVQYILEPDGKAADLTDYAQVIAEAEQKLDATPGSRAQIAALYFKSGDSAKAIDISLAIIEQEKSFKGHGQGILLEIFNALGNKDPTVQQAKKKLNKLYIKYNV